VPSPFVSLAGALPLPEIKDMDLRDRFAGQALVGLLIRSVPTTGALSSAAGLRSTSFADEAYKVADAMPEAKKRQKK
jgi:hypothetical protein